MGDAGRLAHGATSIWSILTLLVNIGLKLPSCKGSQEIRMYEHASFTTNQLGETLEFEAVIESGVDLGCVDVGRR